MQKKNVPSYAAKSASGQLSPLLIHRRDVGENDVYLLQAS